MELCNLGGEGEKCFVAEDSRGHKTLLLLGILPFFTEKIRSVSESKEEPCDRAFEANIWSILGPARLPCHLLTNCILGQSIHAPNKISFLEFSGGISKEIGRI